MSEPSSQPPRPPSPFLPSPRHERRRLARQQRRRRRLQVSGGMLLGVAVAGVLLGTHALESGTKAARHAPRATAGRRTPSESPSAPPRAPGLSGPGGGTLPAISFQFRHPPRAALLFDVNSGRVLWAYNANRVLPVASLTKMMTALLVVRGTQADTRVLVTHRAYNTAGSKVGVLPVGREVRAETLLYGLLLPSGNDAAVALAEGVAGSVPAFVAQMNAQAARLGLSCTHFVSPDGLEDGNRACAADLAALARLDLAQPRIERVSSSASAVEPLPIKGGRVWLYNNNPLLRFGYPGTIGLKTGETEAAGRCLVGAAEREGVRLGVVLLGSPELGRQAEALLNAGFHVVHGLPLLPSPPVPPGM